MVQTAYQQRIDFPSIIHLHLSHYIPHHLFSSSTPHVSIGLGNGKSSMCKTVLMAYETWALHCVWDCSNSYIHNFKAAI